MSVALDAPLRALFDRVPAASTGETTDLESIGKALVELAGDTGYLRGWLDRLGDRSGSTSMHVSDAGPRLTLVHRTEAQMSAVHDHGTWVAIAPVTGLETHRRWRVRPSDEDAGALELVDHAELEGGGVVTLLPPDDVHDHGRLAGRGSPAYILVLLGDTQTRHRRNEWDLATGRHRVLVPGDGGRFLASEPFPD